MPCFWRVNSRSSADRWASSQPCVAEMFEPTISTRYLAGFWVTKLQNNLLCLGESTSTSNFAGKPSKNCLASSETRTLKSSMYVYIITFPNLTENTWIGIHIWCIPNSWTINIIRKKRQRNFTQKTHNIQHLLHRPSAARSKAPSLAVLARSTPWPLSSDSASSALRTEPA